MALLPEVGLNCLTCMMVSASLWWMDGCQHESVTYSPSCFSLSGGVLFTPSLVFLIPHLLTPSSSGVSRFPICVSPCWFLSAHLYISLTFLRSLSSRSSVQSIVCWSNMWQVVRGKSNREDEKKLTDKSSFPRACL